MISIRCAPLLVGGHNAVSQLSQLKQLEDEEGLETARGNGANYGRRIIVATSAQAQQMTVTGCGAE